MKKRKKIKRIVIAANHFKDSPELYWLATVYMAKLLMPGDCIFVNTKKGIKRAYFSRVIDPEELILIPEKDVVSFDKSKNNEFCTQAEYVKKKGLDKKEISRVIRITRCDHPKYKYAMVDNKYRFIGYLEKLKDATEYYKGDIKSDFVTLERDLSYTVDSKTKKENLNSKMEGGEIDAKN